MNGLSVSPEGGSPAGGAGGRSRGPGQRLGRNQRLTRSSCFREAFDGQRKEVGRYMVLWLRAGDDVALRLGVVTSRKVGCAVERSRARRLLREAFRRNRDKLSGQCDIVLVARAAILTANKLRIEEDLLTLARRAGICSTP